MLASAELGQISNQPGWEHSLGQLKKEEDLYISSVFIKKNLSPVRDISVCIATRDPLLVCRVSLHSSISSQDENLRAGVGRKLRFNKVSHMWYRGKSSHYLFCSNYCSCWEELQKPWYTCWRKWPCATQNNNIQDLSDCLTSQKGKLKSEVRSLGQSPEVPNRGARISRQVSTLSPLHSVLGYLGYK